MHAKIHGLAMRAAQSCVVSFVDVMHFNKLKGTICSTVLGRLANCSSSSKFASTSVLLARALAVKREYQSNMRTYGEDVENAHLPQAANASQIP